MIRRILTALIAAMLMLVSVTGIAMAAPPDPCVPGVTVSSFTDSVTHNKVQVTTTVTCHADGTVDDISYEYETLAVWHADSRGNGRLVPVGEITRPGPWQPCGPPRARDVCN